MSTYSCQIHLFIISEWAISDPDRLWLSSYVSQLLQNAKVWHFGKSTQMKLKSSRLKGLHPVGYMHIYILLSINMAVVIDRYRILSAWRLGGTLSSYLTTSTYYLFNLHALLKSLPCCASMCGIRVWVYFDRKHYIFIQHINNEKRLLFLNRKLENFGSAAVFGPHGTIPTEQVCI